MRVLVTGGAGYIGSHTLVDLLEQAHEVCVLDNFCSSSPVVLDRVRQLSNRSFDTVEGDVRDRGMLAGVMSDFGPEAVIHFAGLKSVGEGEQEPLRYHDTNVSGTIAVLHEMDRAGCRNIVFSSSATVYGPPDYLPYDEDHPTRPTSVYGRTKLIAEQIITDWAAQAGRAAALLRYFNPVGAHASARLGEAPDGVPRNLMPYVAQVATGQRSELTVFGDDYDTPDGTGCRDYIHVADLAQAHVAALSHLGAFTGGRAFNIGTGQAYSVREMVHAFERACGRDIPMRIAPRRPGDIAAMEADPSRARAELGWAAACDLDAMMTSAWAWQSRNPQGYETDTPLEQ